jgi:hypothetical protein
MAPDPGSGTLLGPIPWVVDLARQQGGRNTERASLSLHNSAFQVRSRKKATKSLQQIWHAELKLKRFRCDTKKIPFLKTHNLTKINKKIMCESPNVGFKTHFSLCFGRNFRQNNVCKFSED